MCSGWKPTPTTRAGIRQRIGPTRSLASLVVLRDCVENKSSDSHRRRHYSRHLQLSPNCCSAWRKRLVLSNFRATSSPTSGVRPSKFHLLRSSHGGSILFRLSWIVLTAAHRHSHTRE